MGKYNFIHVPCLTQWQLTKLFIFVCQFSLVWNNYLTDNLTHDVTGKIGKIITKGQERKYLHKWQKITQRWNFDVDVSCLKIHVAHLLWCYILIYTDPQQRWWSHAHKHVHSLVGIHLQLFAPPPPPSHLLTNWRQLKQLPHTICYI